VGNPEDREQLAAGEVDRLVGCDPGGTVVDVHVAHDGVGAAGDEPKHRSGEREPVVVHDDGRRDGEVVPVGGVRPAYHPGEEPEPRDGFDVGVDLDMQVGAMRPHGVLDRVSAVQALDAGDVVGVQEPMRAAVEGRHQRGRHGGVAQSERVAELMAGDRDEVDGASPGRDGDRPGLGLVEVRVPHDRSDRRRRHRGEERVGQNAAWSVEREAIPMVSGSELDDDLWPGRQCHRGEAQRGPTARRPARSRR
jgi:hypothetical protein